MSNIDWITDALCRVHDATRLLEPSRVHRVTGGQLPPPFLLRPSIGASGNHEWQKGLRIRPRRCACFTALRPKVSDYSRFPRLLIPRRPDLIGSQTEKEDHMITLLTMHELHGLTVQELGELHQLFSMLLIETEIDTPDRRSILASLENIERAMGQQARPTAGQARFR
ncbi:hypothetical protein [Rhodophyticola porphyridii]|uniref:hypothetical protein n=1 Tax=Rhodophyticola porphyridii TaxID=1852017 RepID=UPI0035D07EBD